MPKRSAPAPSPAPDTGVPTDSVTKKRKSKAPLVIPEPEGWRQRWDLITELRRDRTAVVDQMGSEAIAASSAPGADRAYETLVSLMLSSQTKDTVNMATMKKLRDHGCTVQKILQTPDERLDELIHAVGFHNTKTKHIKQATQMISDNNAGKIPDTMDGLLALPGVGPKMALIILRVVFGKVEGISVDTHVHRIANQLAWTGETSTKTPEHTRAALEAWMPREVWEDVNLVLVGLGQEVQTEKAKLLSKCCGCSRPADALRLAALLGIKVQKELKKAGLDVPSLVVDEDL
jgi:endonuclease-3